MKRVVVVFSGYNQRAVISFLRTIESNRVDYCIVARDKNDPILFSSYTKNVLAIRESSSLDISAIIKIIKIIKLKLKTDKLIIAPSTEALNRLFLANIEMLKKHACDIPLVAKKLYENISDKQKFYGICRIHGISVPKEFKDFNSAKLPFVAKPKNYYAKNGKVYYPVIIANKKERRTFSDNYPINEFYYEKYIGGKSYYLLYYFYKNGSFDKLSQENLIQQPFGKSIIGAISSRFHMSNESHKYENLLLYLRFFGLIMIEVKVHHGKSYMIEANPRFWGPSQLFIDANYNLFESFLFDFKLIKKIPIKKLRIGTRYFWFGGIVESEANKNKIAYHTYSRKRLYKDVQKWMMNDIYYRKDTIEIFKNEII